MCFPCCWPFADAWLEDPDPPPRPRRRRRVVHVRRPSAVSSCPSSHLLSTSYLPYLVTLLSACDYLTYAYPLLTPPYLDFHSPFCFRRSFVHSNSLPSWTQIKFVIMQSAGAAMDYDEYLRRQRTSSPAASATSDSAHTYTYLSTASSLASNDPPGAGTMGSPPPPPSPQQPPFYLVACAPGTYCAPQAYVLHPRPPEPAPVSPGYYCVPATAVPRQPDTSSTHAHHHGQPAQEVESAPTAIYANNPNSQEHAWFGRTAAQVAEDNQTTAVREGVYARNAFVPKDPRDDQFFWVVEPDGRTTVLRTFDTIENMGWEGEWKLDDRHGNLYFQRKREEN